MKFPAVIFDCDGTLVDSLGPALESFHFALQALGEKRRTDQEIKKYFGGGADRIFLGLLDGDREKASKAFELYCDHQTRLADRMRLHDGIRDLLERFKKIRVPMAVVTGRHARDMEIVLKPHAVADYFGALIADSHLPKSKPAPDGILLAAAKLGVDPKRCFYVGDSVMDVQAAHGAGSLPIAALWDPLAKPDAMEAEKPAFMAKTPAAVFTFYERAILGQGRSSRSS